MTTKARGSGNDHGSHLGSPRLRPPNFSVSGKQLGRRRVPERSFAAVVGGVRDLADPSCSLLRVVVVCFQLKPDGFRDSDFSRRFFGMSVRKPVACPVSASEEGAVAEQLDPDIGVLRVRWHPYHHFGRRVFECRKQESIDSSVLPVASSGPLPTPVYGIDTGLAVDADRHIGRPSSSRLKHRPGFRTRDVIDPRRRDSSGDRRDRAVVANGDKGPPVYCYQCH